MLFLKIAIFHDFPPCGGKRALFHFTEYLAKHGHVLDLYTLTSSDETFLPLAHFVRQTVTEEIRPMKLLPACLPLVDQGRNVLQRLRYLEEVDRVHHRVAQKIHTKSYDLAFVHNCGFTHVPNLLQHLKIPSVYYCAEPARTLHEPQIQLKPIEHQAAISPKAQNIVSACLAKIDGLWYGLSEPIYQRAYRRNELANIRSATQLLTNSYYSREVIYRTYGIFPKVTYLGVDTDHFCPIAGIKKENIILSVGRLEPSKQHHVVVESVGRISPRDRPSVVIIGSAKGKKAAYLDYIQKLAESLDVSVQILLSVSEEELIQWYNRVKAVVFIPVLEPFGFISLEAMACGTPLIGVKEGGIREVIVHETTGLFVERDPRGIAEAILRIFQDHALAERLSRLGREYVCEQWTWEKSYQQLVKHFEFVLR
jgi:glycosyltransferase involved in cell wall biosynthesis